MSYLHKRVLENTTSLVLGQMFGVILAFVASIFLIRSLGSTGFGEYTFLYAFLSLFGWLVVFGTDNILVREAIQYPEEAGSIWFNGFFLQLIFAAISFLLMLIVAQIFGYSSQEKKLMILAGIELFWLVPWRIVYRILQVELQQWRAVLATLIRQFVWLLLLMFLINLNSSLEDIIWVRTATAIFELFLMWYFAKEFIHLNLSIDFQVIKKLLLLSWPLALTSFSIAIYHRIDRVLIERYLDTNNLGIYATADNIAVLMGMVPLAFMTSIFPLLSDKLSSHDNFFTLIDTSFRWVLVWSFVFALFLTIIGPYIVIILYGNEFEISGQVLKVLVWAQVASCYGIVITQILIARNLQFFLTISTLVGALINVLGNIIFLPLFGIIGAAWVTVFSYIVSGIMIFLIFPKTRAYSFQGIRILLKITGIAFISYLVPILMQMDPLISFVSFSASFGIGLWALGLINKFDIKILLSTILIKSSKDI